MLAVASSATRSNAPAPPVLMPRGAFFIRTTDDETNMTKWLTALKIWWAFSPMRRANGSWL